MLLDVKGVSKSFDERSVLADVSFQVAASETVCILGPSGCGKTTLLNILIGLDQPDAGQVVCDTDQIGFLFQDRELLPWRSVLGNATLGLEFQNVPQVAAQERAQEYLAQLFLADAANLYPHQISGGMKRRTALAQVLATHPARLFLDEPLTGLDVNGRRTVAEVIKAYTDAHKAAAVIVTHSIEEAIFLADRVLIFSSDPARVAADVVLKDIQDQDVFQHILDVFSKANPRRHHDQAA